MKLDAFHCDINTRSTFIVLKRLQQDFCFHLQLIQKYMSTLRFSIYRFIQIYKNIYQLRQHVNYLITILISGLRFFQLSKKAAFSDRININSLILIILHSMQSAILDDKSSPRTYPRDEIAAQARCAERLNHVGFWQTSHRLSKYVNYEMPAEEAKTKRY